MTIKTKLMVIIVGALAIALFSGWGWFNLRARSTASTQTKAEELVVVQDFSYIRLNDQETVEQADAIFLGKVISISPTRWNQDSGEPWDDGLLIYQIEFEVIQPIVDTVRLDKQATITMLGNSPLDGYTEQGLKVGDQAVIFVGQTDLAWREGGSRPILALVGDPTDAYYLQRSDGLYQGRPGKNPLTLDEVVDEIRRQRPTLVQP